MRKTCSILATLSVASVLAACADQVTAPAAPPETAPSRVLAAAPGAQVVPGRYVVVFRDEVADAPGLASRLAAAHGGTVHYTYRHAIKGFAATLSPRAVEALGRNPNVAYVQPDQLFRAAGVQYNAPWGLDRVDQRYLPLSTFFTYASTGSGVRIYVIDTGIRMSHPDFEGRASPGYDAFGGQGVSQPGDDCSGHGTHVAGIAGSETYGVAKDVSLVSVRSMWCDGNAYMLTGSTSTLTAGVEWVTAHHVPPAVANMSVGGFPDAVLENAIRNSIASGVTYVIGAGNGGVDACGVSPANVAEALTVGATMIDDQRATNRYWGSSNYGSCVDVFAPGDEITSLSMNGGTLTAGGTSMATPFAAGLAARYLGLYPDALPAEVHAFVVENATLGAVIDPQTASPRLLYTVIGGRRRACCTP
ncbi:MAG TPA: S8 family peptidase [Longimicrobium sp.]|nr:S8 family peptidase [Longimicrobium sp.]